MPRPPASVLEAFGLEDEPVLLPGGQGTAWRVGPLVLKPLDRTAEQIAWEAELLSSITQDGFRVARPQPAIVDGWTASEYVDGRHERGRWLDIIAVGERFHAALAHVPRPDAIIDTRVSPWEVGDNVAWGERSYEGIDDLMAALEPVAAPSQLVHCDLTGNVLFHDELPPAILDLAPYWRPTGYASAVVVADALVWEGAPPEQAGAVHPQLLLRALIFRGVTSIEFGAAAVPELELARRIAAR
jgi:uncharacterized protein (TIGR02569 family)